MSESTQTQMPIVKMEQTVSSNIKCFGYDFARQRLRIKFKNSPAGVVYEVGNFTPHDYQKFISMDSRGSYYQNVIRKNPDLWPVRKLEIEGWDGEEKRVCVEPLALVPFDPETQVPACVSIRMGNGVQVELSGIDLTVEQEEVLAKHLCECANALVGIPPGEMAEVVNAGLQALGRVERRKWEDADEARIPDEPSLEEELAVASAARHGVELTTSASARLDAEGFSQPTKGCDLCGTFPICMCGRCEDCCKGGGHMHHRFKEQSNG